jgi:hypothetical protein
MDEVKKEKPAGYKVCGLPTECFSRVVGYLRPVQNWNKGAQANFYRRKLFLTPEQQLARQQERIAKEVEYDPRLVDDINRVIDNKYNGTPGY